MFGHRMGSLRRGESNRRASSPRVGRAANVRFSCDSAYDQESEELYSLSYTVQSDVMCALVGLWMQTNAVFHRKVYAVCVNSHLTSNEFPARVGKNLDWAHVANTCVDCRAWKSMAWLATRNPYSVYQDRSCVIDHLLILLQCSVAYLLFRVRCTLAAVQFCEKPLFPKAMTRRQVLGIWLLPARGTFWNTRKGQVCCLNCGLRSFGDFNVLVNQTCPKSILDLIALGMHLARDVSSCIRGGWARGAKDCKVHWDFNSVISFAVRLSKGQ